jgi:hypothetical protein
MLFEYHNNIVSVVEEGLFLPEIKSAREQSNYKDIIEYVYWNYDRESLYHNILLHDRLKIVYEDHFKHLSVAGYNKLGVEAKALIKKLEMLQYTPKEKLLDGINRKIAEYLTFWNKIKIGEKNHKLVNDTICNAEGLLKMEERISKMVSKEVETRRMGGGSNTLIETMTE